jgi:hypothetical protein
LMDFVDENSVEGMRDALKGSIAELQVSMDLPPSSMFLIY